MYYGLYISAAGANAQNQKVEILSNNLANVDTVGFKRELALLEARDAEAIERGMLSRGSQAIEDIGGGVRLLGTATDFSLGALKPTGIPTDLALEDTSLFFAVERNGEQLLTRAGNFQLREDGVLTSADGDPVLSTDGSPVQVDPEMPWSLGERGTVEQAGEQIELAIFKATAPQNFLKVGLNSFSAPPADFQPATEDDRRVRTGDLDEPLPFDRDVERPTRLLEGALLEAGLRALHPSTETDLRADRRVVLVLVLSTGEGLVTVEQIFEVGPVALVGGRVDVRQVVGDDVELRLQRLHASRSGVECLYAHGSRALRVRCQVVGGQVSVRVAVRLA